MRKLRRKLLAAALAIPLGVMAADSYPTNRRTDWPSGILSNAGVSNGIPTYANAVLHDNSSSASTINSSISSLANDTAVLLTNKTFNLGSGRLQITGNRRVLRGMTNSFGYPTTILNIGDLRIGSDIGPAENWNTKCTAIGINSGLASGSTSIVVASTPNSDFVAGAVILIDQTDDGTNVKDSSLDWAHRPNRSYAQAVQITSISGTTINFYPPLLGAYWSGSRTPQAVGWNNLTGGTVQWSGLENLIINGGSLYVTCIGRAANCWIKNCVLTGWPSSGGSAGTRIMYATMISDVDNIYHDAPLASNSSYAIYPTMASYFLIQNNGFNNIGLGIPGISMVGGVIAYNAQIGTVPYNPSSWIPEWLFPHGGHSHDTIYEGNFTEAPIYFDAIFGGNNSYIGIIRNRTQGWASGKTGNTVPVTMEADMDNITILDNILGTKGVQGSYNSIFGIDASVGSLIRTNNWNSVDEGVHTGEGIGANATANSYYLTGTLEHLGNLAFPPYGASVGASATNLTAYTRIPAGYRLADENNAWPPAAEGGGTSGGGGASSSSSGQSYGRIQSYGRVVIQ